MSSQGVIKSSPHWAWLVMVVSFAWTCYRVLSLGPPEIFADEYSYPVWAKHFFDGTVLPPFATEINNWLYLRVMSLAFLGHGDVIANARLINASIVASSAVPVFLIMVRHASGVIAAVSAVLYAALCAGNAAAYFMPEAMFFTAFAFICLLLIRFVEQPSMARLLGLAVFVGLTSLIKIHAIFLMPALFLAIFGTMGLKLRAWPLGAAYCIALLAIALATNLVLSFILSPQFSFNILGGFYGGMASNSTNHANWHELYLSAMVATNHLLVILPLCLVPLLYIGVTAINGWNDRSTPSPREFEWAMLGVFVVTSLATLLCITALFTVSIATGPFSGAHESLSRLHGRYYENVLAMVIFLGWASAVPLRFRFALPLALVGLAITAAGVWYIADHGWIAPVDFSIVYVPFTGGRRGVAFFAFFALCSLFALAAPWQWARYVMVAAGMLYLVMNAYATDVLRMGIKPVDEDVIPLPGGTQSRVVIVAHTMDADVYRAAYTLIDRKVDVLISPNPQCSAVPRETTIIVSLQGIGPECGYVPHYSSGRVWVGTRPLSGQ